MARLRKASVSLCVPDRPFSASLSYWQAEKQASRSLFFPVSILKLRLQTFRKFVELDQMILQFRRLM
jgi:hypothetical protein